MNNASDKALSDAIGGVAGDPVGVGTVAMLVSTGAEAMLLALARCGDAMHDEAKVGYYRMKSKIKKEGERLKEFEKKIEEKR